jgi:transposase
MEHGLELGRVLPARDLVTISERTLALGATVRAVAAGDQEVFLTAYRHIGELRDPAAFGAWIAAIARHRATDYVRHTREQLSLPDADLSQIHGFGPYTVMRLVAECGDDMTKWPTAKHFTSWLSLAPANKVSGGRLLNSRTRRSSNRATALLRTAAVNVGKTQTALGAFYRRLAARTGKAKAVTATARKLAILFYRALRFGLTYADPGASFYEERYRQRVIHTLHRRAKSLGFTLVAATSAPHGVS